MHRAFRTSLLLYVALGPLIVNAQQVCSFVHKNAATTPPIVLVLRPRVRVWGGHGESGGAAEVAGTGFQAILARTFENEGQKLLLDPMTQKEWEETPPNDHAVNALNDHFNDFVLPIPGSQDCGTLSKISMKGDLERLKDDDRFDVVVVSRARGVLPSESKIARYLDIYGSYDLDFNIGVLYRGTGALLYYCTSSANGDWVDKPDARLSGPMRKCLDQYFHGRRRFHW